LKKIQDELRIRSSELHAAEETKKKLYNEKMLLEERISRLEKKKVDEVIIEAVFFYLKAFIFYV
jgi:hypothetical protein